MDIDFDSMSVDGMLYWERRMESVRPVGPPPIMTMGDFEDGKELSFFCVGEIEEEEEEEESERIIRSNLVFLYSII